MRRTDDLGLCGLTGKAAARPRRAGMTFAELIMAMAITCLVGAAIAGMMTSISSAASDHGLTRDALVGNASLSTRFGSAIRGARMVLAKGNTYLILWASRSGQADQPQLLDLQLIEWDSTLRTLTSYKAPADLNPADNTQYDLMTTDFYAALKPLKGTAKFPSRLWAAGVTGWTCWVSNADPRQARYASYRATLSQDGVSDTTLGGAAMRNQ
jgi:hypothetical protein